MLRTDMVSIQREFSCIAALATRRMQTQKLTPLLSYTDRVGSTGLVLCFVGGWMSDKFGPKARAPLMLASSLTFGVVAPIFINAIGNGDPTTAFFLQFTMALLIGIYSGSSSP